ncbi:MAG TPA: hypothetical protein VED40_09670 [Azospirillaceae bacterium]|nr:hypothetical protein [Azospirillaceae bacterium]
MTDLTHTTAHGTDSLARIGAFLRAVGAELADPTLAVAAALACVTVKLFAGFM